MKIEPFRHLPIVYKERECFLEDDEKYYKNDTVTSLLFDEVIVSASTQSFETAFAEALAFTAVGEIW